MRNPTKWVALVCRHCGKKFEALKTYVNRGQYSYCSKQCGQLASRKHEVKEFNNKRYYLHVPSGYFVSDDGSRLNRDVWEFYNGAIPEDCVIHHKNEDKTDNEITNLELVEWGEHTTKHNSTGVTYGSITCLGCGKEVIRKLSEIKRGQDKFCTKECSNKHRGRNSDGTFNSGHDTKCKPRGKA